MTTYVYRDGKIVDKRVAQAKDSANGNASFVISDEMAETRHMADGKMYTSKAKFREATRAAGCIEVGTETSTLLKPRQQIRLDPAQRRDDIRRTIYELRNRSR
jgi:hypothetical protein